jgi:hypothetical protein
MRNALVRFGLTSDGAADALAASRVDPSARPESLGLEAFSELVKYVDDPSRRR